MSGPASSQPIIRTVPIDQLITDQGTQVRACIIEDLVAEYAARIEAGDFFPGVRVLELKDGSLVLVDGFHRLAAFRRLGRQEIPAIVRRGTMEDAWTMAIGANVDHGLRRTNADKRRAVWMALEHFDARSDRAIAEMAGVHHELVAAVRREFDQVADSARSKPLGRRGRDGKSYPAPPKAAPASTSPSPPSPASESSGEAQPTPQPSGAASAPAARPTKPPAAAVQAGAVAAPFPPPDEDQPEAPRSKPTAWTARRVLSDLEEYAGVVLDQVKDAEDLARIAAGYEATARRIKAAARKAREA